MYQQNMRASMPIHYQTSTFYPSNNQEERLGGFLGPFLLGGLTGGLVAPFFYGGYGYNQPYYSNNYYYPAYPYYYGTYR